MITYGLCGLGALCTHYYWCHYIKLWLCAAQFCGGMSSAMKNSLHNSIHPPQRERELLGRRRAAAYVAG